MSLSQATTWLGYGAKPYKNAEGVPGEYYVPSPHPYQATLPGGIKVQEAYPGQYYSTSGFGQDGIDEGAHWMGNPLVTLAVVSAGGALMGAMLSKWQQPKVGRAAALGVATAVGAVLMTTGVAYLTLPQGQMV